MYIAHRGLVNQFCKENTIAAFKAAIKSPRYVGYELDVRLSKDNKFIVYHDLIYNGKLVKNVLYKDLKKENVPLLEDVLNLKTDKIIMIEIKDYNINLKKLANMLNKYNYKNIYVISFNNKILDEIKKYLVNIKIGTLNYVLNSKEDYSKYDCVCILNYFLTNNLIDYFKSCNIEVIGYGLKNIKSIKFGKLKYIVDEYTFTKV